MSSDVTCCLSCSSQPLPSLFTKAQNKESMIRKDYLHTLLTWEVHHVLRADTVKSSTLLSTELDFDLLIHIKTLHVVLPYST